MKVKLPDTGTSPPSRVKWKYWDKLTVPEKYRPFLWDYPSGRAPLEIYVLRILTYGKFDDIREVFQQFPEETFDIVCRYSQIHRGVRFWIRRWHEDNCG